MKLLVLLSVLLLTGAAFAAEGKQVSYKSGDETVQGILYTPNGKGPFPALLVIHEWWGLDDWVKQQASKFADAGYVALAIDLYRGRSTANPEEARKLARGVPDDRARRDLRAAFDYLKSRKDVEPNRIGSVGWCMGGKYSLDAAIEEPTLAADVIHYGELTTDPASLKQINAPVLGVFGAQDKGIPPEAVKKFEQALMQQGKEIEIKIYPNAGHAFENPANKDRYRPEDAADAWKLTLAFLDRNLKK